jgi:hypothetical protein
MCNCSLVGSGKTMIAFVSQFTSSRYHDLNKHRTAVIDAAKYDLGCPTVFFYCENEHPAALDASSILSSFIKQLCGFLHRAYRTYLKGVTGEIWKFFGHERVQPDLEDLKEIFIGLFRQVSDVIYVVDGVDALDQEQARSLLKFIRSLFCDSEPWQGSRILLLSRDQVPGYINVTTFIPGIRQISTSANVMQDIETYIESSITDKTMCRKLTDDPLLIDEIQRILLAESSGMYASPNPLREFHSVDYTLTGVGFCGYISSWRFFGIHAIQMQKYSPH